MATYSVIGRGDTKLNVGSIDVKVAMPELKELIEKLPQELTVNVESPSVNISPQINVEAPIIKVQVPEVNVPQPEVNVYPRNDITVDLKEIVCRIDIQRWVKNLLIAGVTGLYLLICLIVSLAAYSVYHTK